MSDPKSEENISASRKSADETMLPSYDATHSRQRIVQNFRLILVGVNIDQLGEDGRNMLTQLRSVVNNVDIFTESDDCIQFLRTIDIEKVFVITSGYLGQYLIPDIHAMPQLDTIYIVCGNKSRHEQWTKEWTKVKDVYTGITNVCEALKIAVKQCNQDSISVSFAAMDERGFNQNLDHFESSFMCTQIFKEILLEIEQDEKSIKNLANYCRKFYDNNIAELTIIDEFERDYRPQMSIWWYTRECFTYQMLNRALRTMEVDTLIHMGFFIRDVYDQIEELHQQQLSSCHGKSFIVYRGQGLSTIDFEKLLKTKGGLISFNNFLFTSKNREVSLHFAKGALEKTNTIGIVFKMSINPSVSSAPFATIREVSYCQKEEEEILFPIHTVFRIGDIYKIDDDNRLYHVDLTFVADDDQQFQTLNEHIREETVDFTNWERLGHLLIKLSQFDKAELLYNVLLEQISDESEKALYYNKLGCVKDNQGQYGKAISYYRKGLEIQQNSLPPTHPDLANSYNNIGEVYRNMGEYSTALSFYEKTRAILEETLPADHPDLATSYNNIGLVYKKMSEYSKVLPFYEKALEIYQKTLPSNHPLVATSLNNIGGVYVDMGENSKALSFYEKALEIYQNTLPPNHPSLTTSYNNIGLVYYNMKEYSTTLSFYEKALEIRQTTLPPNHPSLATSYNNIGWVYKSMGNISKALSFYERALDILQSSLPLNHPYLQSVQHSIEVVTTELENSI
jgi:tetratricopeptide (TPR) repeat protein